METYTITMMGESGVGKSAIMRQFVWQSFVGTPDAAAYGVSDLGQDLDDTYEVYRKQLMVDGQPCMLHFVDISTEVEATHCRAFVFVYSTTQRSSYMQLERYYNEMMRTKRGAFIFILVGNKVDERQQREVSTLEGHQKAVAWGCKFFETSAKTRHNVEEAFNRVVRELREKERQKLEGCGHGYEDVKYEIL